MKLRQTLASVALALSSIGSAFALPVDIENMLTTIESEAVDYPDRAFEMRYLKARLADGNFEYARITGARIISNQRNLRSSAAGNLPYDVKSMLETIEQEKVEYPSRNDDLRYVKLKIAQGDFEYAKLSGKKIIQQQRNLRQR